MRLSQLLETQGFKKQGITKILEAEAGIPLVDKEMKVLEREDIEFDESTLSGKDLIIYSHSLISAYRLKNASMKDVEQLTKVIPGAVVIVPKD